MAIALITDFGTADYFVAAMKGTILSIHPSVSIIDITHEIPNHNIREAAFTLAACCADFPAGTVFTVVVDPGVGSARRSIAVKASGYYFVAPDNGVLSWALAKTPTPFAVELINERYLGPRRSTTFHGRDIFAPVSAHIALGVTLDELGPPVTDLVRSTVPEPRRENGMLVGEVIHIDHFGNLITNLTAVDLTNTISVEINGHSVSRRLTAYAEASVGEIFMIEGSAGFIEISSREASAARIVGAKAGTAVFVKE